MTNAIIGALRVHLGIDTAAFSQGLKDAQSGTDRFAKAAKVAFAAVGAAALGLAGAFAAGVRSVLNDADELSKTAAKIGIPIEELSKLKYAADLSGVSLQGLSTSVGRLSRNMVDAASGTGEGAKAFKALGISVKTADGGLKSATQILGEIADGFAGMPDGAAKTAIAMQLMGRSGAEMIPLLNGGSAALAELVAEAKGFGLEISAETGRAAEQFNDNLSRIGYAIQGVTVGLTAALAPALAAVSDAVVAFAQGMVDLLSYLPQVGEYAAVAGGALALMFAPSIVGAVGTLTIAIGTGLVGAIRLLTATMLANPLGAIAVGITVAVTAIYHFRDEIQKAIGVDVVGIVKGAANLVINSFVAAFEDIRFVWNNFPAIMGAAVTGAGNLMITGIERAINTSIKAIKEFYKTLNPLARLADMSGNSALNKILGTGLLGGGVSLDRLPNPAASDLASKMPGHNATIAAIMARDTIGEIGKAFSGSTPEAKEFSTALGGVNDALETLGGGGGKGGKSGEGRAKKASTELDRVADAMERARESLGAGFGSVIDGLINKTMSWKDALIEVGKAILTYFNQVNIAQGGKGIFGGGFLQGIIGAVLGFRANGGPVSAGKPYIVGERGPELMVPNVSGTVISNRNLRARPTENLKVVTEVRGVFVDDGGVIKSRIEETSASVTRAGISQYDRSLPGRVGDIMERHG